MGIPLFIAVLALFVGVSAAPAAALTSAEQVKRLSLDEASAALPVTLKGIVTQVVPEWNGFSMQDSTDGIYVNAVSQFPPGLALGARVEVEGHTGPGNFAPGIMATRVRVTGAGPLPAAEPVSWQALATGTCDNRYVEVQGVVRAASAVAPPAWEWNALALRLDLGGNLMWAYARSPHAGAPDALVDSMVRVRGVCVIFSNTQRHFQGATLFVPRASDIEIVRAGSKDPFAIPAQPIARVFGFRPGAVSFHRVKLEGIATLTAPTGVYIQQGGEGVFVRTGSAPPVQPGDRVEAVGFPSSGAYTTILDDALVRAGGRAWPVQPLEIQARSVLARVENAPVSPDAVLLRVKGRLVDRSRSANSETLVLQDGASVFTARLSAPAGVERLPAFVEPGSTLAVTGVCAVVAGDRGLPRSFELLMRSGADVALLTSAPWLTERRALRAVVALFVVAIGAVVWLALLRRRVRQQTETIRTQLRREAALEERFRDLVENAGDLVYVRDLEGTLLQVNRGMEELTGYPKAELLGLNVLDLLVPQERDRAQREMQSESGSATEWTFLNKDGRYLVIETKQRFLVERGHPVQVECIGRDVTWRKQASHQLERRVEERTGELTKAAESLRASEERFRLAVEAFPSVFVIYDRDRRIQFMNQRGAQLVGVSRDAVAGRRDEELFPPSVTDAYLPALRRCVETCTAQSVECDLDLAARRSHMILNYVPVTSETGELAHILGIAHDMTERKRLEEQLHHSQRLDSIGKLAGGVAHDFNNLLTVIAGYAQMLTLDAGLDEAFREPVEQIARAADRAASLTRQLLIFSRRQASEPVVVEINEVVRNFEKMLRRVIPEDIEFTLALDPDAGSICADPGHIEQVLMNLVVNARDAMPAGGRLGLETAGFHVDARFAGEHVELRTGDYVLLKVSDTGTGMSPEVKERIFEPFFSTKEQGKGTGLGLSTVYGIVKQCGGEIIVYSEPGLGSTFRIFLPRTGAAAAPEQSGVPAAPHAVSSGEETVLLVEDEPAIRNFISELLRNHGYSVFEAANGREALDVLARHSGPVDLLLTDVVMPEMGGHDLARRFLELHPVTPVLQMSGYNERWSDRVEGAQYIEKPFTASALLSKVREILNRTKPEATSSRQP